LRRFKNIFTLALLATMLAFPIAAALADTHAKEHGARIESTSKKRLIAAEDTLGKKVADYTLIDQDGKKFQLKELKGKPYLISFIYTTCTHACPIITHRLADALKKVRKNLGKRFNVLSVGFDVDHDTPHALKEFRARFVDGLDAWKFTTADEDTIKALTSNFGFYYHKEQLGGYAHMNMISVVDSKGVIRSHIYGMEPSKREIIKELKKVW